MSEESVPSQVPFTPQQGWIQGHWETRAVWFDGRVLRPGPSQHIRNHSPDGFGWSYAGSGPAQLALAILLRLTDRETAVRAYQHFKEQMIAPLAPRDFRLSLAACREWLRASAWQGGPLQEEARRGGGEH